VGVAALSLLSLVASRVAAQEATVHIEVPSTQISPGGDDFTVAVMVNDVTNLGALQFDLSYDPAVLSFVDVQEGPFLGSSGREVQCLPPRAGPGTLQFACVTLGATPDGPTGSGVLATITFRPLKAGSSPLHFARLTLTDPPAQALPAQAQDATVTVGGSPATTESDNGGFAWAVWGPVIGGIVVALAAAGGFTWWTRRSQQP
jgi:hypothetical protein